MAPEGLPSEPEAEGPKGPIRATYKFTVVLHELPGIEGEEEATPGVADLATEIGEMLNASHEFEITVRGERTDA